MRVLIIITILFYSILFISCDDAGVTTSQNKGTLTITRLKTIDKNIEGTYELWASVESALDHNENAYRSLGRFAVNSAGELTDTSGGTFTVNMSKIANINNIGDVIISIQPPGYNDTIPSNIKILGGAKQISGSELIFDLNMTYEDILPQASQFSTSLGRYILASPSSGVASSQYQKGLWFTGDTTGSSAGITLPALSDTTEWTYQAWVINNSNPAQIYNTGRFDNPSAQDNNQLCQLSGGLIWSVPGNDWLQANCPGGGLPDITNLESNYSVGITLEPRFEQGIALFTPFYLGIFGATIGSQPFGTVQNMLNGFSQVVPTAQLRLSAN